MIRAWFLLLFYGFLLIPFNTKAQTDSLRLGLALSGGGAKGLAHIGVLEALEQYGIHPQYLSGTSIGAIVGAYYAAGYKPREIARIFKSMDFDRLMTDNLPRRYLPLYIKENGRDAFFYFPVNTKDFSISLPRGLTHYQLFYNRLFKDLFNIQYLRSFDSLPVPVRFVATDLVHGKSIVFSKGSIPQAVIASSAFPSIVAPVKIDSVLYTDGGIFNNFPVDIVKQMGANYVIGSDVQGSLYDENQLTDIPKIIDQITAFYIYAENPEKIRQTDLYIRPKVTGFGVTDFGRADTLIRLGYAAAMKHQTTLKKLSTKNHKPPSLQPGHPDSLYFSKIVIRHDKPVNREYLLWKTGFREKKKISFEQFEAGINFLYGTGDYLQILYSILPGDILIIKPVTNPTRAKFKTGFRYSPLHKINVLAGITYKRPFNRSGIADLELILGDPIQYRFSYIRDNGYHFGYGFASDLNQIIRTVPYHIMLPGVPNPSYNNLDLHWNEWNNRLFFLITFPTQMSFKAGLEHKQIRMFTTVFSAPEEKKKFFFENQHYLTGFMDFYYDDLDDFYFPTGGIKISLRGNDFFDLTKPGLSSSFQTAVLTLEAHKNHGQLSTSYILQAGLSTHTPSRAFYFYFGGIEKDLKNIHIVPFFSRDYFNLSTLSYVRLQPQLHFHWKKNHHFYTGLQGILMEKQTGKRFETYLPYYNIYLRYGFKSFFGPIFVSYAMEPVTKKQYFNFTLGFYF